MWIYTFLSINASFIVYFSFCLCHSDSCLIAACGWVSILVLPSGAQLLLVIATLCLCGCQTESENFYVSFIRSSTYIFLCHIQGKVKEAWCLQKKHSSCACCYSEGGVSILLSTILIRPDIYWGHFKRATLSCISGSSSRSCVYNMHQRKYVQLSTQSRKSQCKSDK